MRIVLHCRDERGWPILTVDPPVIECGDGVRIQNYAAARYADLLAMCRRQREATKAARAGGRGRGVLTFAQLLAETFGKADESDMVKPSPAAGSTGS